MPPGVYKCGLGGKIVVADTEKRPRPWKARLISQEFGVYASSRLPAAGSRIISLADGDRSCGLRKRETSLELKRQVGE